MQDGFLYYGTLAGKTEFGIIEYPITDESPGLEFGIIWLSDTWFYVRIDDDDMQQVIF